MVVLVLLGGCATYRAYPGKKRPRAEVAVLSVPMLTSFTVDEKQVPEQSISRIELLPGRHVIEWDFAYPNRFQASQRLSFAVCAGERYRLGQRFFAAPHPAGPIGALLELGLDTALLPVTLLLPLDAPTEPPEGEYYCWMVQLPSQRLVAGTAPDVPMTHTAITFVPMEEE